MICLVHFSLSVFHPCFIRGWIPGTPDYSQGRVETRGEFCLLGDAHAEVLQQAVAQAVDPAVYRQRLAAGPGVAHHGRLADVDHLFDDVQFAQATASRRSDSPARGYPNSRSKDTAAPAAATAARRTPHPAGPSHRPRLGSLRRGGLTNACGFRFGWTIKVGAIDPLSAGNCQHIAFLLILSFSAEGTDHILQRPETGSALP